MTLRNDMIPKDIFKKESFSFQFQIRIKGLNDQVLYLGNTDRDIQNGTFASSCKKIKNSTYSRRHIQTLLHLKTHRLAVNCAPTQVNASLNLRNTCNSRHLP